jgi:hypothetical protein
MGRKFLGKTIKRFNLAFSGGDEIEVYDQFVARIEKESESRGVKVTAKSLIFNFMKSWVSGKATVEINVINRPEPAKKKTKEQRKEEKRIKQEEENKAWLAERDKAIDEATQYWLKYGEERGWK